MSSLSLVGNLRYQPSAESQPATLPINVQTTYTQKSEDDYVFTAPQTDRLLDKGSLTAPRMIYIELYSGEGDFSFDSGGTNPFRLSMNDTPTPAPTDKATFVLYTHNPRELTLYLTSLGPVSFRVFLFS